MQLSPQRRPTSEATLVATLTSLPTEAELAALPPEVRWLEVRADLLGETSPQGLREASGRQLLFTLRSAAEGGEGGTAPFERQASLLAAHAAGYDLIDLEAARDLSPQLLAAIPPEKRLLSWHGGAADAGALFRRFASLEETSAALYKLVPAASTHGDELAVLSFLARLGRGDVVAFPTGALGSWVRLLAPRFGAPVVYGSFAERPAAPGQPAIRTLIEDFGLPGLRPIESLFGIAGNPVSHSLSPRLHNGCYRALGLPFLYLPFHVESFGEFWLEEVESELLAELGLAPQGLSVTAPFKESALAVAAESSLLAEQIGAANTLVLTPRGWLADSTDPEGVLAPLVARGFSVAGQEVAVVGAGGAGRSTVVGLQNAGARVTLVNRSLDRGERVAAELGVPFVPLEDFMPGGYALVVNAATVGREGGELPFAPEELAVGSVVLDLVYGRGPTPLVSAARRRGLTAIDGREVLLAQAREQFERMSGKPFPHAVARGLLGLEEAP